MKNKNAAKLGKLKHKKERKKIGIKKYRELQRSRIMKRYEKRQTFDEINQPPLYLK